MEDDDEVVIKNSALYHHLLENGFEDFECTEATKSTSADVSTEQCDLNDQDWSVDIQENENFDNLVEIILKSNLVFNDDVAIISNFTIYHKTSRNFSRSQYVKLFSQTAAASAMCWLCSFGGFKSRPIIYFSLTLIPSGILIAKRLRYYYIKNKETKLIQGLVTSMKDLSMMVQKCIQFIQESEILTYNSISRSKMKLPLGSQSENVDCRWQVMFQLRNAVHNALRSNILNLKTTICNLVKNFPLKKSVDELNFYLAFLSEEELQCLKKEENQSISVDEIQKMKYVCLLLQSELLKRLCLNLNPSLWVHRIAKDEFFALVASVQTMYAQQYSQLRDIFLIYYTFEKPDNHKLPNVDWIYKEAYVKICSVSLNLQTVLKNGRNIEEFLENTRVTNQDYDNVISKLDSLSEELISDHEHSRAVLEDFRNYILHLKPKDTGKSSTTVPSNTEPQDSDRTAIFVGTSDFRPSCPDEIFIGVSTQENKNEKEGIDDDFIVKTKCSNLLISELKLALQDKAQEWKERERIALKNKNLDVDFSENETETESEDEEVNSKNKNLNKVRKRFSSESSEDEQFEHDARPKAIIFPTGASFAEQIAQVSSQWALKTQDYVMSDDEADD